ncbi:Ni-sirohydrochlorin a,c-diamide synthase [Methanogenium organophilum]|uniref:Cobyrinate a,c-diamide synthase n=1 Tax=Methanogenium organophilum TaxID=2199 RepID=A0A9X9T8H6_METOG|nr:Ni-sirohydrochlorin a,c-diamide synthase [Methanogenium organophilum]WAI01167.1 Ni-sirohydrochlorin a,c-diamide synthase [Methanogenium organophilum]
MKSLLITGDRSGSGKTSITLAIAALLSEENIVQPFKVAMDYIDPSYLTGVTGRACRNLDSFVMDTPLIHDVYANGAIGADISIVEGVRGLYEGSDALTDRGSTASIAKTLDLPVILVVDARSITRSAAALVKGFQMFDPAVRIKGVILNQVKGGIHREKATKAIEHACGIPVIGAIPRSEEMKLTMRHLGLVPFLEGSQKSVFTEKIQVITRIIGNHVDFDQLLDIAKESPAPQKQPALFRPAAETDIKIGIALDESFNFYYNDLFDILRALGAEPVFFSPIHDRLPDADGYIIGGGYPELFADKLEDNTRMRDAIREVSANGAPIYAECGGLIYLTEDLILGSGYDGRTTDEHYAMAGVFEGETRMPVKRVIGYVEGIASDKSPLGGGFFAGHEFHHTDVRLADDTEYAYRLTRGKGIRDNRDGAICNNTIAGYTHLHPSSVPDMFRHFTETCRNHFE